MVPQYATVLREGQKLTLKAEEITIGDIIEVKFGDRMPADVRVIEARGFKVLFYLKIYLPNSINNQIY